MKMFEVKDYGIISENHSALWIMCVNMQEIRELDIGAGCWATFVSCGMKSDLYVLRVADDAAKNLCWTGQTPRFN